MSGIDEDVELDVGHGVAQQITKMDRVTPAA
jgi:hypothetical protein